MRLVEGDRVDRYVIVAPLGSGGMGDVFRARDTRLDRLVALKVLLARDDEAPPSASLSKRMVREAHAVAALEHPNVVAIYDVGEVEWRGASLTYIAMELIQGAPLRAFIGDASIPMGTRVRWLLDVARALTAAHAAGIVHRDVKPENVMVRADGVAKVLDFGIAKRAPATTDTTLRTETADGVRIGTPYYMAPEQMRGEAIDARADQFSWGVLAYELLCGRRPWTDDGDAVQLVAQLLTKNVDPPRAANPEIPDHVSEVIARALAKSPEQRFASMAAIVSTIESEPDAYAPTMSAIPVPRVRVSSPALEDVAPLSTTAHANITTAKRRRYSSPDVRTRARSRVAIFATIALVGVAAVAGARAWTARTNAQQAAKVAAAAAAARCESNAACSRAHEGKPYVCHHDDGTCASLESEDCKVYADARALESDDTVWIGAMFPLTGPDGAAYRTELEGVDLARRDFEQVLRGVIAAKGAKPLGLVGCDDQADAKRAATHLVDQVRAPAVIGFQSGEEVVDLAPSIFVPKGVLVVVADSSSPLISSIPQPAQGPRLVWSTVYSGRQVTRAMAAFVEWLEAHRARGSDDPFRVAHVRGPTTGGLALTAQLLELARKPGVSAKLDIREFLLDPAAGDAASANGVVASLLAMRPDVVVSEIGAPLVAVEQTLEQRWTAKRRPLYVSVGLWDELLQFIGGSAERRHRFFGMSNLSSTPTNLALTAHFNGTYEDRVSATEAPNSAYDALYVVGYAALASGTEATTGSALARSIARLVPPGQPIDVGPLQMFDAFKALSSGGHIDLNGAIGHLDFDLATGEAPVDMTVLCAAPGAPHASGSAREGVESGLTYDATRDEILGALHCR